MSKTSIPEKVKIQLWTLSAGRCEYKGCNRSLWRDDLSMVKMNNAYIAHIVAESANGPRGDSLRSAKLSKDINNLMLLCSTHHRIVDVENVEGHPENLLLDMKKEHENRIELVTSVMASRKTNIVLYGANIGHHSSPLSYESACEAIIPDKYPKNSSGIEIGLINSQIKDDEDLFWNLEVENLERQIKEKVETLKMRDHELSLSVFALAPQPLLIKLGTLLSDLKNVDVYQRHREPATWKWKSETDFDGFKIIEPDDYKGVPILNLSLSATITNDRIVNLFDSRPCIWTLTHNNPNNDFLKTPSILSEFRTSCRQIFDLIKSKHGQNSKLHIFPAMPVSAAIEFGRVWMPKADLDLIIYDQNKNRNGFYRTINI